MEGIRQMCDLETGYDDAARAACHPRVTDNSRYGMENLHLAGAQRWTRRLASV
ncbi:MAG: hypothetical protein QOF01_3165 [Thermomicrobiales bacterium]|jgi:hypothetical protein|nr:hypothetical protein [Thermomicrobiales bacterium]